MSDSKLSTYHGRVFTERGNRAEFGCTLLREEVQAKASSGMVATQRRTQIVLVRHGHVEGIDPPRFRGRVDLTLTAQGVRQAELTRDYLAQTLRPAAVCTSPLSRCVRTGEILAQPFGLTTSTLADFVDINYGAWQGKSYDEVQASEPTAFSRWCWTPHLAEIPEGETLHDLAARVARVMRTIVAAHRGQTVLLVGHDTVNRISLLLALDMPLARFWRLGQQPCAVNVLEYDDATGWIVQSLNETGHLRHETVAHHQG
jgi:phosphoserine phosphatase